MMQYWSNSVNENRETGELYFDGDFSMKAFYINFMDDANDIEGYMEFRPLQRSAWLRRRSSADDCYSNDEHDLYTSEAGRYLCAAMYEYNLNDTYKYALQFLKEKLTEN